jgi:hypothetical protein
MLELKMGESVALIVLWLEKEKTTAVRVFYVTIYTK